MTTFTAEGLLRAEQARRRGERCSVDAALMRAYQRWLSTQERSSARDWKDPGVRGWLLDVTELHAQRAPGTTCLSALRQSLKADALPSVANPPNNSKGCGAVMRSAPFGLVARDAAEAFKLGRLGRAS